jgi:hypothetical protein
LGFVGPYVYVAAVEGGEDLTFIFISLWPSINILSRYSLPMARWGGSRCP